MTESITSPGGIRLRACALDDLPPGAVRRVDPPGHPPIAVFNVDGEVFATADTCTHAAASLSEGALEGDQVVCPVHWACFDVRTGRALGFPATVDLDTFPVDIEGGHIVLRLPDPS